MVCIFLEKAHFLALRVWITFMFCNKSPRQPQVLGGIQFESTSGGCIASAAVSGASTHGKYLEPVEPGCTARGGQPIQPEMINKSFPRGHKNNFGTSPWESTRDPHFWWCQELARMDKMLDAARGLPRIGFKSKLGDSKYVALWIEIGMKLSAVWHLIDVGTWFLIWMSLTMLHWWWSQTCKPSDGETEKNGSKKSVLSKRTR